MCTRGSPMFSTTVLSSSVSSPSMHNSICFSIFRARSRTRRDIFWKVDRMPTIRSDMDNSWIWRSIRLAWPIFFSRDRSRTSRRRGSAQTMDCAMTASPMASIRRSNLWTGTRMVSSTESVFPVGVRSAWDFCPRICPTSLGFASPDWMRISPSGADIAVLLDLQRLLDGVRRHAHPDQELAHLLARFLGGQGRHGREIVRVDEPFDQGFEVLRSLHRVSPQTTCFQAVDQDPEGVHRLQQNVHMLRCQHDQVVAGAVHQAFGRVGQALDVLQFQETRQSLEGVAGPEHHVDRLVVGGVHFQLEERLLHVVDVVAALGDEIHDEGGIGGEIRRRSRAFRRGRGDLGRLRTEHHEPVFGGDPTSLAGTEQPEPFPEQVLEAQQTFRAEPTFLEGRLDLVDKARPFAEIQHAEFALQRVQVSLHELVTGVRSLLALQDGHLELFELALLPAREPLQQIHPLGIRTRGRRSGHDRLALVEPTNFPRAFAGTGEASPCPAPTWSVPRRVRPCRWKDSRPILPGDAPRSASPTESTEPRPAIPGSLEGNSGHRDFRFPGRGKDSRDPRGSAGDW
jgi:hypothetical protein